MNWLLNAKNNRHYDPTKNSVTLVNMHSSKGLDFPVVFNLIIGFMHENEADLEQEARLLYVARTCAVEQLFITGHCQSTFLKRLKQAQK